MAQEEKKPSLHDQGRAAVTTGSTTQGGSNYGQGSSHLGGESIRQGHAQNAGANYENETNKFGASNTDSANDGNQSPGVGAPDATHASNRGLEKDSIDINNEAKEQVSRADFGTEGEEKENDRNFLTGDRGATTRDVDMNLDNASEQVKESGRPDTGAFSQESNK